MDAPYKYEWVLSFMRLLTKVQRVPARLPNGQMGNALERAFFNSMIALWRAEHEPDLFERDHGAGYLVQLCLVEPFELYVAATPEDAFAPEIKQFRWAMRARRYPRRPEDEMAAAGFEDWSAAEVEANPEYREYLELVEAVRRTERKISVAGRSEPENDAEHSVTLALLTWFITMNTEQTSVPYSQLAHDLYWCNQGRLCVEALTHDVKEAYSGDTPAAGDPEWIASKPDREEAAVVRLESAYPWLGAVIRRYDKHESVESVAVYQTDKVIALIVIGLSGGGTWKEIGYSYAWDLMRLIETCKGPIFGSMGHDLLTYFGAELHSELPNREQRR